MYDQLAKAAWKMTSEDIPTARLRYDVHVAEALLRTAIVWNTEHVEPRRRIYYESLSETYEAWTMAEEYLEFALKEFYPSPPGEE